MEIITHLGKLILSDLSGITFTGTIITGIVAGLIVNFMIKHREKKRWTEPAKHLKRELQRLTAGILTTVNQVFQSLKEKQQDRTLVGKWKQKSWRRIALEAGFNELHASSVYSYLCEYAHSSSLSTLQIRQAKTKNIQKNLFAGSMNVIMIAVANIIFSYCKIFPKGNKALQRNLQTTNIAQIWVNIGQQSNINK